MTLIITALDVMETKHRYGRRHAAPVDESMGRHNAMNSYVCPDKQCICHDLQPDALDRWQETILDIETNEPGDPGGDFVYGCVNGFLVFYDTAPPAQPRTVVELVAFLKDITSDQLNEEARLGWCMGYAAGLSEAHPNRFWTSDPAPVASSVKSQTASQPGTARR